MEYARTVLGRAQISGDDVMAPVACATPAGASEAVTSQIVVTAGSLAAQIYRCEVVEEAYFCEFRVESGLQTALVAGGLRVTGRTATGEARIVELPGHPFFMATLFLPQATSRPGRPHPLIAAFLEMAARSPRGVRPLRAR